MSGLQMVCHFTGSTMHGKSVGQASHFLLFKQFFFLFQLRQFLSSEDSRADDNDSSHRKATSHINAANSHSNVANSQLDDDIILDDGDLVN